MRKTTNVYHGSAGGSYAIFVQRAFARTPPNYCVTLNNRNKQQLKKLHAKSLPSENS